MRRRNVLSTNIEKKVWFYGTRLAGYGGMGGLVEVKIERRNAKKKPGLQLKKTGSAAMAECHETLVNL